MRPIETLVLYGLAGICVGVAFLLRGQAVAGPRPVFALASLFFWPLLVPVLLLPPRKQQGSAGSPAASSSSRLQTAMAGLDGVASELALPEIARVRVHAASVVALETRVADMDALLATPDFDHAAAVKTLTDLTHRGLPDNDSRVASVRGRLRNIERLRSLRQQSAENLERVCLQIEEITAQLKLLRFAGGSTSDNEAVAAMRQVADNMQSMTEVMLSDVREARA
jgi:hypothetical protein